MTDEVSPLGRYPKTYEEYVECVRKGETMNTRAIDLWEGWKLAHDHYKNNKNQEQWENTPTFWEKLCDSMWYPTQKVIKDTKVRFDGHIYIEIKLPFFTGSIKLCLTSMWILFFILYMKL